MQKYHVNILLKLRQAFLGGSASDVVDILKDFKYSKYTNPQECVEDLNRPYKEHWNEAFAHGYLKIYLLTILS